MSKDKDSDYIEFEVDANGTLWLAGESEPLTREGCYDIGVFGWSDTPAQLKHAMERCQPLAWEVHSYYNEHRDAVSAALTEATNQLQHARLAMEGAGDAVERKRRENETPALQARVDALTQEFAALPEEPEDGVERWLLNLSEASFQTDIVPAVDAWLSEPPNWSEERDYIPNDATDQGSALEYFRDEMSPDDCELLGVQVVEGEGPGSSYYAAELTISIKQANAIAEEHGLGVRFSEA
jgi:hypothetical protein